MEKQVGEKSFCVCVCVWRGNFLCLPPPLLPDGQVPPRPSLPSFSPWPVDSVGGVAFTVLPSLASEGEGARRARH